MSIRIGGLAALVLALPFWTWYLAGRTDDIVGLNLGVGGIIVTVLLAAIVEYGNHRANLASELQRRQAETLAHQQSAREDALQASIEDLSRLQAQEALLKAMQDASNRVFLETRYQQGLELTAGDPKYRRLLGMAYYANPYSELPDHLDDTDIAAVLVSSTGARVNLGTSVPRLLTFAQRHGLESKALEQFTDSASHRNDVARIVAATLRGNPRMWSAWIREARARFQRREPDKGWSVIAGVCELGSQAKFDNEEAGARRAMYMEAAASLASQLVVVTRGEGVHLCPPDVLPVLLNCMGNLSSHASNNLLGPQVSRTLALGVRRVWASYDDAARRKLLKDRLFSVQLDRFHEVLSDDLPESRQDAPVSAATRPQLRSGRDLWLSFVSRARSDNHASPAPRAPRLDPTT